MSAQRFRDRPVRPPPAPLRTIAAWYWLCRCARGNRPPVGRAHLAGGGTGFLAWAGLAAARQVRITRMSLNIMGVCFAMLLSVAVAFLLPAGTMMAQTADEAQVDELFDALNMPEVVQIMRDEPVLYGRAGMKCCLLADRRDGGCGCMPPYDVASMTARVRVKPSAQHWTATTSMRCWVFTPQSLPRRSSIRKINAALLDRGAGKPASACRDCSRGSN